MIDERKSWFSYGTLRLQCFSSRGGNPPALARGERGSASGKYYLFGSDAIIGIDSEHPVYQVGYLLGEVEFVAWVFCIVDFAVEFLISGTAEGENASEGNKSEHSQSPYICRFASVFLFLDDLGSHIAGSAAEDLDLSALFDAGAKAEVNEFGREGVGKDDVL